MRDMVLGVYRNGLFVIGTIALEEALDFTGRLATIFAYALGSVTLAASVGALQPFVIMIYIYDPRCLRTRCPG